MYLQPLIGAPLTSFTLKVPFLRSACDIADETWHDLFVFCFINRAPAGLCMKVQVQEEGLLQVFKEMGRWWGQAANRKWLWHDEEELQNHSCLMPHTGESKQHCFRYKQPIHTKCICFYLVRGELNRKHFFSAKTD